MTFFRLPQKHRTYIVSHAKESVPREACGLVIGHDGLVTDIITMKNLSPNSDHFRMDPLEQLGVFQRLEKEQKELMAIYHSHPSGPAYPSNTDIDEFYYPGVISLIISKQKDTWKVHAFLISEGVILKVKLI
jgi:proteasome lid subunit RPN8/RPN11